ncbi:hypothetical protein SAMN05518865_10883 [Duganella sp. CF458]|uniref:hypothetical protein n=1 Tax=Duganella sp. CF458 TaxID=1884368 RepID=UPI0008EAFAE0|nr:hypothetical protein [Duganella sp. CF458]SFG08990.1 hypothetical protein SAMN05518865_10883 [Duganella sp. CF458]
MSSISSLSNCQPASRYGAPTVSRGSNPVVARLDTPAASAPSTIVTLSPEALAAAATPMSTSQRYQDLGADMLKQLGAGAAVPVDHAKLPDTVDNRFTLSITTRSGAQVDLTLANVDDDMIYQVSSSAELDDDERKALTNLAASFQAAIDGMTGPTPQVRLNGLTQFDSKFLESIDFHAEVAGPDSTSQALDFHIDDSMRRVSIGGPEGQAEVNVDTSTLEHLGTRKQQAKAINSYLAQFDQAVSRGHGDKKLMSMFKDAFADMNRTAVAEERDDFLRTPSKWQLNSDDRSALTGLSDFSASLKQTPKSSNPLKAWEQDTFSYDVSQATKVEGTKPDDRKINQTQQSHLGAQFHTDIGKSSPPWFDGTLQTQNYEYHEIDDNALSNVSLNYRLGKLKKASLEQMASQSENVKTIILGKLQSEKTIPSQQSLLRDLLPSLTSYEHIKGEDTLNENIPLLSSPGELVARNQQF